MELFDKHNEDVRAQVGINKTAATLQKYENSKRHFTRFLKAKYNRTDLKFSELTPLVIHNFEIYLLTVAHCCLNTATKILKLFKTITLYGRRHGFLSHDPFVNKRFHTQDSNRGFLTDEEIQRIIGKEISIPRLDLVRDIFIFSCFSGLAYIDVSNLTEDNIVELDGREWIMTRRQKTRVATNIILLDIPKRIIEKYAPVWKKRSSLADSLQSEDECLSERDSRFVQYPQTPFLSYGPAHICHDVFEQRRSHRIRVEDAGTHQYQNDADLRPYHQ